jgi:hypothetical protein
MDAQGALPYRVAVASCEPVERREAEAHRADLRVTEAGAEEEHREAAARRSMERAVVPAVASAEASGDHAAAEAIPLRAEEEAAEAAQPPNDRCALAAAEAEAHAPRALGEEEAAEARAAGAAAARRERVALVAQWEPLPRQATRQAEAPRSGATASPPGSLPSRSRADARTASSRR